MATRTLDLSRTYKRRLLHLRMLCGSTVQPELVQADVLRVEKALGHTLGDALLALVALRTSLLDEYEVRLDMLPRHTKDVHAAGMAEDLVGLGRHADSNVLLAATTLGTVVHRLDVASGETHPHPVEEWLEMLCAQQQERLRDAEGEARARIAKTVSDEAVSDFTIVVRQEEGRPRVHHAKFGGGEVLRELSGDKLEVRFDSGEVKTLMRSFLRPTD